MFKKQVLVMLTMAFALSSSAFAQWTAIAYDPIARQWGRGQCAPDYASAVDTALSYCNGNCQIVAYSENGFVSLATGGGSTWGTGDLHDSQFDAEQSSLQRCESNGAVCQTLVDGYAFDNCQ